MKVEAWLFKATKTLEKAGIGTARLDSLVLLEDATGKERGWLLAHQASRLDETLLKKLNTQIKKRATHEPLAYIRGKTEFYGRNFGIDHRVLEPRPESETMIELLKSLHLPAKPIIVDLGTGSGAIAITAQLELPASKLIATDIDAACLAVAKQNAKKYALSLDFIEGDLLEPLAERKLTAILANLPYVPDHFQINPAAMREPRIAIFGGPDGLELYRKLFVQLKKFTPKPKFVLTEALPPQHETLAKLATGAGYHLEKTDDFIQVFRNMS